MTHTHTSTLTHTHTHTHTDTHSPGVDRSHNGSFLIPGIDLKTHVTAPEDSR